MAEKSENSPIHLAHCDDQRPDDQRCNPDCGGANVAWIPCESRLECDLEGVEQACADIAVDDAKRGMPSASDHLRGMSKATPSDCAFPEAVAADQHTAEGAPIKMLGNKTANNAQAATPRKKFLGIF